MKIGQHFSYHFRWNRIDFGFVYFIFRLLPFICIQNISIAQKGSTTSAHTNTLTYTHANVDVHFNYIFKYFSFSFLTFRLINLSGVMDFFLPLVLSRSRLSFAMVHLIHKDDNSRFSFHAENGMTFLYIFWMTTEKRSCKQLTLLKWFIDIPYRVYYYNIYYIKDMEAEVVVVVDGLINHQFFCFSSFFLWNWKHILVTQ